MRNTNLKNAKFVQTNLKGADVRNSDLREVHLSGANFKDSIYNEQTIWPEGFDPKKAGAIVKP